MQYKKTLGLPNGLEWHWKAIESPPPPNTCLLTLFPGTGITPNSPKCRETREIFPFLTLRFVLQYFHQQTPLSPDAPVSSTTLIKWVQHSLRGSLDSGRHLSLAVGTASYKYIQKPLWWLTGGLQFCNIPRSPQLLVFFLPFAFGLNRLSGFSPLGKWNGNKHSLGFK